MSEQLKYIRFPDYITILGLICASVSMWFSFNESFYISYSLIIGQFIFDSLDGKIARKYGGGELGIYLDSFSDYTAIISTVVFGWFIGIQNIYMIIGGILFFVCAAIRLSFFTVRSHKNIKGFLGVPTVLSTIIIVTIIILNYKFGLFEMQFLSILYFVFSYLMISDIKIKKI